MLHFTQRSKQTGVVQTNPKLQQASLTLCGPLPLNAYANYEICLTIWIPATHTLPAEFRTFKNPTSVTWVISHFYIDRFWKGLSRSLKFLALVLVLIYCGILKFMSLSIGIRLPQIWQKVLLPATRTLEVNVAFRSTSTPVHTVRHNPNVTWISKRAVFMPLWVTAISVSSRTIDSLHSPKTCSICLTSNRPGYLVMKLKAVMMVEVGGESL